MQIADQESEEDRRDQAAKSVFLFVSFFFFFFLQLWKQSPSEGNRTQAS